jgi:hypothetical protein
MGEDGAKMYEWFDRVGFTVDRAALRRQFPDVALVDRAELMPLPPGIVAGCR